MGPVVRLTEATWERLKGWAEPLEDSADDVIKKVLDVAEAARNQNGQQSEESPQGSPRDDHPANNSQRRLPPGQKTLGSEYRTPILKVLNGMGGKGPSSEVVTRVGDALAHILTEADRALLPSGVDVRWRNTAQWERLGMVQDGLLRDDSQRGTWELTPTGRKAAETD